MSVLLMKLKQKV